MSARPIEGAPGYREADRRTAGSGGPATVHEARVAAEERKSIPSLVRDLIDDVQD